MGVSWSKDETRDKIKQICSKEIKGVKQIQELFKGHYETLLSEGEEADLHKHFLNCLKNPGHTKFIPVNNFSIDDLPESYQESDLYNMVKVIAFLTVRFEVKMTRPHRPKFHPDTNVPYPFYDMRNKTNLRLGTGEVDAIMFIDGLGFDSHGNELDLNGGRYFSRFSKSTRTCPCTKCQHSDKPNNVWWEIIVHTATHVVFDDIKASQTSCTLFYDEQDSPVVKLNNFIVHFVNLERNICVLKCVTCDMLGGKLFPMAEELSKE